MSEEKVIAWDKEAESFCSAKRWRGGWGEKGGGYGGRGGGERGWGEGLGFCAGHAIAGQRADFL